MSFLSSSLSTRFIQLHSIPNSYSGSKSYKDNQLLEMNDFGWLIVIDSGFQFVDTDNSFISWVSELLN